MAEGKYDKIVELLKKKVSLKQEVYSKTKDVFEFFKEGRLYNYVVTVCDEASAARCPIFPGVHKKINWSFEDPSSFAGDDAERLNKTIIVRDTIKNAVMEFIKQTGTN